MKLMMRDCFNSKKFKFGKSFFLAILMIFSVNIFAQQSTNTPELSEGGLAHHLGQSLDMSLTFQDQDGRLVAMADLVSEGRPLMLTLNYFRCTTMCTYQLMNLAQSLAELGWVPGDSFSLATVSFDPTDTPNNAKILHDLWLKKVNQPQAKWSFLVGSEQKSKQLADKLGFYYKKEDNNEYSHVGGLFFITSEGVFKRYLYGIVYEPQEIKYALTDTSNHKLGSFLDHLWQYLYFYDATRGRYLCRFSWPCSW